MDIQLFEKLLDMYTTKIYRYCLMYLQNHHDAQDCTQNTFLKLYQNKHTQDEQHLKNWLYIVARNECLMYIRRNKKNFTMDITIFENIAAHEDKVNYELILNIPEKYREIFYLYYYEGYNQKEIATMLELSIDTIKKRMVRGRTWLKDTIGDEMYE